MPSVSPRVPGVLSVLLLASAASAQFCRQTADVVSPGHITDLHATDVDGDGLPDVLFSAGAAGIGYFPGDGHGGLLPSTLGAFSDPYPYWHDGISGVSDVNGDGWLDVVTHSMNAATWGIRVAFGTGAGTWAPSVAIATALPLRPLVADLDADGLADVLAVTDDGAQSTMTLFTLASGVAVPSTTLTSGHRTLGYVAGDFNLDGLQDVAGSHNATAAAAAGIEVFYATAPGVFAAPISFPWGAPLTGLQTQGMTLFAGDVDQDGDVELGGVSVLMNPPYFFHGELLMAYPSAAGLSTPAWVGVHTAQLGQVRLVDVDDDGPAEIVHRLAVRRISVPFPPLLPLAPGLSSGQVPGWIGGAISGYLADAASVADFDLDGDLDFAVLYVSAGSSPATVRARILSNRAVDYPACAGSAAPSPSLPCHGPTQPGNALFSLGLAGAPPNAGAVLFVSLANPSPYTDAIGCVFRPNLDPDHLILPFIGLGIATADAAGAVTVPLPLPPANAFGGSLPLSLDAQWLYSDATGPVSLFGSNFGLSPSRRIVLF
jgi:hypothetical protein